MSKTKVKVKSPTALEAVQLEKIGKTVAKFTENDVVVDNQVDRTLLGGIKIEFGTNTIDLTMDKFITELEEEINE